MRRLRAFLTGLWQLIRQTSGHGDEFSDQGTQTVRAGRFGGPRVRVIGTVESVEHSGDNDIHVVVDGLVCELIAELPLTPPTVGRRISIWGIPRYDGDEGWWEIHPVIGWKTV